MATPIRGVIFDLGHTLMRFDGEWGVEFGQRHGELAAALVEMGYPIDPGVFGAAYSQRVAAYFARGQQDWVERTATLAVTETLAEFGLAPRSDLDMAAALESSFAHGEALWEPYPDAAPTLQILHGRGYRLGLVSNSFDAPYVYRLLERGKLRSWFQPIVVSAEVGVRKPNPRIFWPVLREWALSPQEVVVVGDMLGADILGAHEAGMRAIWAAMDAARPANREHISHILPDAEIRGLGELPEILATWMENG